MIFVTEHLQAKSELFLIICHNLLLFTYNASLKYVCIIALLKVF